MVLILSSSYDQSTSKVIDWLKVTYVRIGRENNLVNLNCRLISADLTALHITYGSYTISLQDINTFWYRRDDFILGVDFDKTITEHTQTLLNLEKEWNKFKDFLHVYCEAKKSIGSFRKEIFQNKLTSLFIAQQIGLKIPSTLITTQKKNLVAFIRQNGDCITKAISNMFKIKKPKISQTIGTQLITAEILEGLDETISPTLIQEKVEKIFELRIFYMKKQFYSMAIFSQNDEKTQLDYRNYNSEKPNRNIPHTLPTDIQNKLQSLMDKLDLDSGSIDMIVTPEGEYVFLEVNPTGQFGWVSENCNYYLEEIIANYLQNES
jgi:ATP-GRASP peptide maturase of grasp-with-spasm system